MNDADKKKLIDDLMGLSTKWDLSFSDEGRRWFVDRVIRSLESATPATPDSSMAAAVGAVVTKANAIVKTKAPIQLKVPVHESHSAWYGQTYPRRVEIIYGAIAFEPALAETANEKFLDLVIRRRYRAMMRMELFVNGFEEPLLYQYPNPIPPGCKDFRINQAATPLWASATPHREGRNTLPRWTIAATGTTPLEPAIEQLWTPPTANCQGNVLECATAMSTVLMDSLLEAKDPSTLLRALRTRGPLYLAICNPTLADAQPNFVLDRDPRAVFTIVGAPMGDLQVGDYVYVWNHPLYQNLFPGGDWRGEHAVVSGALSRDPLTGFRVTGHGVSSKTIADLHAHLLSQLQTTLDFLYIAGKNVLEHLALPAPGVAPDVTFRQQNTLIDGIMQDIRFYQFDRAGTFTDYDMVPPKSKPIGRYIMIHLPALNQIGLFRGTDLTDAQAHPTNCVVMERKPGPLLPFAPEGWGIPYRDPVSGAPRYWDLFQRVGGRITIRQLSEADMPSPPLAPDTGPAVAGQVRMVRPTHRPTPAGAV